MFTSAERRSKDKKKIPNEECSLGDTGSTDDRNRGVRLLNRKVPLK